ncbi:isochorismatase family protein, partial [Planococcus kocurii]|uniref:isochorismatase family protein n=1 Tax=Planococcus kocurii TaxID=1374 RepID=UPI003D04C124
FPLTIMLGFIFLQKWLSFQLLWWLSFKLPYTIDTVIIVGCSTSGCIRATVVDALQHGYLVVVPEECVGDRSQSAHDASLSDIQMKYGDVVSLETVKKYLTHLKGDISYV